MSSLVLNAADTFIKSDERYDSITIIAEDALISYERILEISESLNVHGTFTIKYSTKVADAENELKLAGFISVVTADDADANEVVVSGIKPDLSASGQRRIKRKIPPVVADLKSLLSENGSVELLDDSALLKEEDLVKPLVNTNDAEACGPQAKKKACKNCSCGLKEVEEAAAANAESATEISNSNSNSNSNAKFIDTSTAKSSCGSVRLIL